MRRSPVMLTVPLLIGLVGLAVTPSALASNAVLVPPHIDFGHDTDDDDLFDYLVLEVHLLVAEAGIFRLEGRGSWHFLAFTTVTSPLERGVQSMQLAFVGALVRASGFDGPYTIDILLFDERLNLIDETEHVTHGYSYLEFEGRPAVFTAPHSEYGLDTDGDGLFNFLVVEASILVSDAGDYSVKAEINWPSGPEVATETQLEVGQQRVTLRFGGGIFVSERLDGPYAIRLDLWDTLRETRDRDKFQTASYSHLDFEPAEVPASFTPPHTDYGLDTDGNGTFDHLVVAVNLEVEKAGSFTVGATLTLGSTVVKRSETQFLAIGSRTVALFLDGRYIRTSGMDGPYAVELTVGGHNATHITAGYGHLEFEPVAVALAPPYTDFGLDVNDNGLYDYLSLIVPVNVETAGTYEIGGLLYLDSDFYCCDIWLFNETDLEVGTQNVSLRFSGEKLRLSRVDGPYRIFLWVTTGNGIYADWYETSAYDHREFEKPSAVLSPAHSDYGWDVDQDGRFDFLVVDVGVEVRRAGIYHVSGLIFFGDPSGGPRLGRDLLGWVDATTNITRLDVGTHQVRLWFYGQRANLPGIDGPYSVSLSLARCEVECIHLATDDHYTAAYSYLEFQEPKSRSLAIAFATVAPTIDGAYAHGEWDDASAVNFSWTVGNSVAGFLLVKNDDEFLYLALDAIGDASEDPLDTARLAFDTGNDETVTEGAEDEFVLGGHAPNNQAHYVSGPLTWGLEDAPYDTDEPGHKGLASARGFGPSAGSPFSHRIYEFAIPLGLLALTPGDSVGFQIGGHSPSLFFGPGLYDDESGSFSSWPVGRNGMVALSEYAVLVLADVRPTVAISFPQNGALFAASDILVGWSADDVGTGVDRFELRLDDGPSLLLEATARGHEFQDLADGSHRVELTVFDAAGHARTDAVNFTVDTTPPSISLPIAARPLLFHSPVLTVFFTIEDLTSGIDRAELSLDGGTPRVLPTNASAYLLSNLKDGPHTLELSATDRAGNERSVIATFIVDTNPFSPSGPNGPVPLLGLVLAAVGSLTSLLILRRWRKNRKSQNP